MKLTDLQRDIHLWQTSLRASTLAPSLRFTRLMVEVGELAEAALLYELDPTDENRDKVASEVADVIHVTVGLGDVCGIDVDLAVALKLLNTFDRYPPGRPIDDGIS